MRLSTESEENPHVTETLETLCAAIAMAALLLLFGSALASAQVVASATGSGQIYVSGEYRTFTFTAHTDSSGVTTGQTQGFNRSSDIRWHGVINCLDVEGNVATMSGMTTDATANNLGITAGEPLIFQVIDNGEGSKGTSDLISLTFFSVPAGSPPFSCLQSVNGIFANLPIDHGNVKVH